MTGGVLAIAETAEQAAQAAQLYPEATIVALTAGVDAWRETVGRTDPTIEDIVDERLLGEIGKLNRMLAPGQIGPVGAVVGPTHIKPELDLAGAQALFLAPGVGAQGATPEDVAQVFAACPARVMPSASRSLLSAGPDIKALQDRAAAMASEFRRLLSASTDATARTI